MLRTENLTRSGKRAVIEMHCPTEGEEAYWLRAAGGLDLTHWSRSRYKNKQRDDFGPLEYSQSLENEEEYTCQLRARK